MVKERVIEGTLLDETTIFTRIEFCEVCRVEDTILLEMVSFGIIEPMDKATNEWRFTSQSLLIAQKALRLHQDLAINWQGISLALDLLEQIDELQAQIAKLQTQKKEI
jgi:chaperone modulatory protein CbpM